MTPPPAKKEDDIAQRVEEWTQQCDRLAKYGAEFNMGNTFKVVALQKIVVGETRRVFDTWKIEGGPIREAPGQAKRLCSKQEARQRSQ